MEYFLDKNTNTVSYHTEDKKSGKQYKIVCKLNDNNHYVIEIIRKHISGTVEKPITDHCFIKTIDTSNYAFYYDANFLYPILNIPVEEVKKTVAYCLTRLFALALESNDIACLTIIKGFDTVSPTMQNKIIQTLNSIINNDNDNNYLQADDQMEQEIVKALEYAELSRKYSKK